MTGTIFGIKRMEMHDGDGIRTTVFFKGCPLKCIWCHNPEGISFQKQVALFQNKCIGCGTCGGNTDERTANFCPADAQILYGTEYDAQSLAQILYQDKPYFDNSGGGVTFSGGECLMQARTQKNGNRRLHRHLRLCETGCFGANHSLYSKVPL